MDQFDCGKQMDFQRDCRRYAAHGINTLGANFYQIKKKLKPTGTDFASDTAQSQTDIAIQSKLSLLFLQLRLTRRGENQNCIIKQKIKIKNDKSITMTNKNCVRQVCPSLLSNERALHRLAMANPTAATSIWTSKGGLAVHTPFRDSNCPRKPNFMIFRKMPH